MRAGGGPLGSYIREEVAADLVRRLEEIDDPSARLAAAHDATLAATDLRKQLLVARGEAAQALSALGRSWASIGRELGVSAVRARAMSEGRDRTWG